MKPTLLLCTLLLAGCAPRVEVLSPQETAKLGESLTYFKDDHGGCYAALATRSYGLWPTVSITRITCEERKGRR